MICCRTEQVEIIIIGNMELVILCEMMFIQKSKDF